jgi:hypothetical protein
VFAALPCSSKTIWPANYLLTLAILHRKATQGDLRLDVTAKMAARAKVRTLVLSHLRVRVGSDEYTPSAKK